MSNRVFIYLAGPVTGKDASVALDWRKSITECLRLRNENFVGVSPLRCESPGDDGKYPSAYSWEMAQEITAKNQMDVKRCDVLLAYLPDASSIGVLLEIGWAAILAKPIIVLTSSDDIFVHPILMSTVPFLFKIDAGGVERALDTITGLFSVYVT